MTPSRDIGRLLDIMAALRTPDTGCPWDLAQNFSTIAPYTVEEAYEVADAIARGDLSDLKEELGDLLLQVVFHARMAEEQGAFAFGDVVQAITEKLIRRHPHVFGDERSQTPRSRERPVGTHQGAGESRAQKARGRYRRAGRRAAGLSRPHPRAQAAGQSQQGRLRLERSARGVAKNPRGSRRDRGRARPRARSTRCGRGGSRRSTVRRRQSRPAPATPIRKRCCGRPTRNSSAASPPSSGRSPPKARTPQDATLAEMDALWDEAKARE